MPRRRFPVSIAVGLLAGCQATPEPAPAPTTRPHTHAFRSPDLGIAIEYPADWSPQPITDTTDPPALRLAGPGGATLSLIVPTLPAHVPGWIPVGLVANGYIDDIRKRLPDATGPAPDPVTVPRATARRVSRVGHHADGQAWTEEAILIVHGDRIYILATDATPAARPATTAALNDTVASIRWLSK